ncbi:hypothetical protein PM082_014448 [Marasmius tenuissimus]|nr:hypothetical protein PM082_014448 [Marasmius tenuissimus]
MFQTLHLFSVTGHNRLVGPSDFKHTLNYPSTFPSPTITLSQHGIHLVLFTACIFVLARRRHERIHVHRFLVTALFVLATCGLVLEACNATLTMYTYHVFGVIPCDKPESAGSKVNTTTEWGQRPSLSDIESATESPRHHINNLDRAMQAMIVTSNVVTDIILGIASTLIIVRTALGIAINDEKTFRATVLGEGDGGNGESRGIVESVLEVRRPDESVVLRDGEHVESLEDGRKSEVATE